MIVYIVYLLAVTVTGLVCWKGDRPLRSAAMVMIVSWAFTPMIVRLDAHGLNLPVTFVDIVTALIFVWLSMRWRRLWGAVLAALTIVCVAIRLVASFDPGIDNYSRAASYNVVTVLQLVVLLVATWLAVRARRRANEGAVRS
jgi:hypothetical protein